MRFLPFTFHFLTFLLFTLTSFFSLFCAHSSMDRATACEAVDSGSIPDERNTTA